MRPEHLALLFFGMGMLKQVVSLVLLYIVDESSDAGTDWGIFCVTSCASFVLFVFFVLSGIAAFI